MNTIDTDQLRMQMIEKLGLSALSQKRQDEVMDKVTEALLKTIFAATAQQLSNKERDELGELMDDPNTTQEQAETYLRDKIDDYDNFLQGVVDQFLDELLQKTA